jgi:hypothetical protein
MRTALAVAAGLLAASLVAPPAEAVPETTIGWGLPRGAAVAVPHVEQQTVVDGDLRLPVDADYVFLVGTSGSAYVVQAGNADGEHARILRVARDGTVTRLARAYDFAHLSHDGQTLVTTRLRRNSTSTTTVRSAATGVRTAARTFRGYVTALDVAGDRVLLGGSKRTMVWHPDGGTVDVLDRDQGYLGDLESDVVAVFIRSTATDEGACTRIQRISTGRTLSTLCDDLVLSFNADATRIATTTRYLDGPISVVRARTVGGRVLGQYRTTQATSIGVVRWETPTALLLEVLGAHRTGTVRCTASRCELAGRPLPNL